MPVVAANEMICIHTKAGDVMVAAGRPTEANPVLILLSVRDKAASFAFSSSCILMVTSTSTDGKVSLLRRPSRMVRVTRPTSLMVKPAATVITSLNACCTIELKSANVMGRLTDKITVGVKSDGLVFEVGAEAEAPVNIAENKLVVV